MSWAERTFALAERTYYESRGPLVLPTEIENLNLEQREVNLSLEQRELKS